METIEIPVLVDKIKSFSEELDDSKYTVSRFNPSLKKQESNPASWVKTEDTPVKAERPK